MRLIKIEAKHCDNISRFDFNAIETWINIDLIVGIHRIANKYGKDKKFFSLKLSGYQELEITEETFNLIMMLSRHMIEKIKLMTY